MCAKVNTNLHPTDLAIDLLGRSTCIVQVAAVLHDRHGIFSWGWNHAGSDGMGSHAEDVAIFRANPKRLKGATITVAGIRKKSSNPVLSLPCEDCMQLILSKDIAAVQFMLKNGVWTMMRLI